MSQSRSRYNSDLRTVTSHVHPRQPCILCKYFHPKSWKDPSLLEHLKEFEPSLCIEPESCICRPCYNELKDTGTRNDRFVPRWRKSKGMTQSCFVPECTNSAQKVTKLANESTLRIFFPIDNENIADNACQSSEAQHEGVPLCTEHYGTWYRYTNPSHKWCKTCGKSLTDLSKSCPYTVKSDVLFLHMCMCYTHVKSLMVCYFDLYLSHSSVHSCNDTSHWWY